MIMAFMICFVVSFKLFVMASKASSNLSYSILFDLSRNKQCDQKKLPNVHKVAQKWFS